MRIVAAAAGGAGSRPRHWLVGVDFMDSRDGGDVDVDGGRGPPGARRSRPYHALVARPTSNLRLFVAAYPPSGQAEQWLGVVRGIAGLPAHRLTPPEQAHITLQFIGDTPAKEIDATIESMERAASGLGAFSLTPRGLIALPERGPARLIALEADAPPALLELKRRLVQRLAAKVKPEKRAYRPHLTLCRFRSPARFDLPAEASVEPVPFAVSRILLMRSTLSPNGAQHHEVAACALE
jgi:RNA 2',3'-cyclic 3'-phosphodiesterase